MLLGPFAGTVMGCAADPDPGFADGRFDSTGEVEPEAEWMQTDTSTTPDVPAPDERLDVGAANEPARGCHSVDILFVIDNSGSMCDYQERLVESFPEFVDAMFEELPPQTDVHVGIVTTSFSDGGLHRETQCVAQENPQFIASHFDTQFNAHNGFQGRLYEHDGARFFEANTSSEDSRAALQWWFAHAATEVGCDGGAFEYPAAAAARALSPAVEEYNQGFLRDELSTLAVFVLSDEVGHSPQPTEAYRQMVLDAKSNCGGQRCVVTGGLLSEPCMLPELSSLWRFLNAFERPPVWGNINDPDAYANVFSNALSDVIVQACEELDPAG